jgi:hypothetical protein
VYSRCIRCRRSLGTNAEIAHLSIGRRIAFDSAKGRLWVVCSSCDQWNLVPIEERWEALAECEHIAGTSESRGGSEHVGFARTERGLELLRVGGLANADIANWRYGRRLARLGARGLWIWPWQQRSIYTEPDEASQRPSVVIPRGTDSLRLQGHDAVTFLASMLPRINGTSCAEASIRRAVARVGEAERKAEVAQASVARKKRRRKDRAPRVAPPILSPWERLVASPSPRLLANQPAELRLALEIAVTEDLELSELESKATESGVDLGKQEEIAAIADSLLIPDEVAERLRHEHARVESAVDSVVADPQTKGKKLRRF